MSARSAPLPVEQLASIRAIMAGRAAKLSRISTPRWDSTYIYRNSKTGKIYTPHNQQELDFIESDAPRWTLATGGEGAGKTTLGSIKTLRRIQRGMSGIVVSPTLPHFAASTWAELSCWIPWQFVMERDRYMSAPTWMPTQQFEIVFNLPGYPKLQCGGLVDSAGRAVKWEGPNVHFFWFDEARRAPNANGLKVLTGRPRLVGPHDEPPQGFITTTGGCPWLTEYFGPLTENDKRAEFKADTHVIQMLTTANSVNVDSDYARARLTVFDNDTEKEIYSGENPFGEISDHPYLENIAMWDKLKENLPDLTPRESVVIALDAGETSDSFALVGVSRHPLIARHADTCPRFAYEWKPKDHGGSLNFGEWDSEDRSLPIPTLVDLTKKYNIFCVTYDVHQLHQPVKTLEQKGKMRTWFRQFDQGKERLIADNDLRLAIINGKTAHNGMLYNLRQHLQNANRKTYTESDGGGRRVRIVKRGSLKIDLAVAFSMADYVCRFYNL